MRHITKQLDGERLREWLREGFVDTTVLVVPMGCEVMECAFRVMDVPSHTEPPVDPRAATLDEVACMVWLMAERVGNRTDLTDLTKGEKT